MNIDNRKLALVNPSAPIINIRGLRLLVVKSLARNGFLILPHEDRQFPGRTEAAQCLQGCGRLCGGGVATPSGGFDFLSGFRRAAMGDEDIYHRRHLRLSDFADFFVGV